MVKQYLVLHGASTDYRSQYATTSALDYRGINHAPRPPASPWMGEPQSRHGYMGSGYQNVYFRDKPPADQNDDRSVAAISFSRPNTTSLADTQLWPGEKDATPLKSCLQRGEVKEPRFYPFKMGSAHGAQALISPMETNPAGRFQTPLVSGVGQIDQHAHILKSRGKAPSGFSTGNDLPEAAVLITAPQGQTEHHVPALTMREAERVSADSSRRYFHARDYYDNPYMSSSNYYQNDAMSQHADMKRRKESLTAVPSTRPQTQYALAHNDAPYANDVGDGVGKAISRIGEGIYELWGKVPPESERVGLMPTGFTNGGGLTNAIGATAAEPPPAPPLPERFARIRARHDYLRWGGSSGDSHYHSTSRVELCKPSLQQPLGGARKLPPGGAKVVATDGSGYHMQITANPITPDVF